MVDLDQRVLDLESVASQTNRDYYAGIGKSALTVITGIAAVVAFLANSHHVGYIEQPDIIRRSLYLIFILYSSTYVSTLIGTRFYSHYVASMRDLHFANSQQRTETIMMELKKQSRDSLKRVATVDLITEATAILGTLALALFSMILLHNILNNPS